MYPCLSSEPQLWEDVGSWDTLSISMYVCMYVCMHVSACVFVAVSYRRMKLLVVCLILRDPNIPQLGNIPSVAGALML